MSERNNGGEGEMLTLAAVMGTVCFFDPDKRWMIGPWPPQSEGLAIWVCYPTFRLCSGLEWVCTVNAKNSQMTPLLL